MIPGAACPARAPLPSKSAPTGWARIQWSGTLQVRTIFKEKLGFPAKEAQLFSDFFCFCGNLVLIQPLEDHGAHGPGGDPIG